MTLDHLSYLDHLRRESARFREVLGGCDPAARVPACPDWDAADLLWHLATVQSGWAKVVRHRPTARGDIDEPDPVRPASYAELLDAFDDFSHALATELERADPADEAWHWSADHRVATTFRRQAHEALIHRLDAEETAGVSSPMDPVLAADGVAEVLGFMYGGGPSWGTFTPSDRTIAVRLTDTGTELLVALGRFVGTDPDDGTHYDEDDIGVVETGAAPAASIAGTAADLDTWLWHRGAGRDLTPRVEGDESAYQALLAIVGQPLN